MWSNTKNFSGKRLLSYYRCRLAVTILICIVFVLTMWWHQYLQLVLSFISKNGKTEVVEELFCKGRYYINSHTNRVYEVSPQYFEKITLNKIIV